MKPAIAFAIVRQTYGSGFNVIAITSESGGKVYGRDVRDNAATNRARRDVVARLPTRELADLAILRANEAYHGASARVGDAEREVREAREAREQAVKDAIADVQARHAIQTPTATPGEQSPLAAASTAACNKA